MEAIDSTETKAPRQHDRLDDIDASLARTGMTVAAERLFARAGYLRAIAQRLASYMTERPASRQGRSILDVTLEAAIHAYYMPTTPNRLTNTGQPHKEAACRFVQALINRACDLLGVEVRTRNGTTVWDPMGPLSIGDICRQSEIAITPRHNADDWPEPSAFRRHLATQVLTAEDIVLLGTTFNGLTTPPD